MNEVCGMISPIGNDEEEQPATIEQLANPASHYKACRMPLSGGLTTAGAVSPRGIEPGPSRSNPTVHVPFFPCRKAYYSCIKAGLVLPARWRPHPIRSKNINIFAIVHDRNAGRSLTHGYADKKVREHFFISCNKFLVLLLYGEQEYI